MDTQNPGGTPAVRRGSSGRCPASKSGECLKSVSASVHDHPACTEGCELNPWARWNIHCGPCALRFETLGDLYVHVAEIHDA